MQQYLDLLRKVKGEGIWVENTRTQTRCKTIINADLIYDVENNIFPLITTRKGYFRQAIGEMLGYIRGYTRTEQFHALGVRTWDANATNPAWVRSPMYEHVNATIGDLGAIYGASGNYVPKIAAVDEMGPDYPGIQFRVNPDLDYHEVVPVFTDIVEKLRKGEDDRGLIWNFWNPGLFHLGCLRPCMYNHQFSLLDGKLYLNSVQRSCDLPLGGVANMVQCFFLLWLMAKLTGHQPGQVYHKIVNVHIYENQLPLVEEQLSREPFPSPSFHCSKDIDFTTHEGLMSVLGLLPNEEDNLHPKDFYIENYQHHLAIAYPFTV